MPPITQEFSGDTSKLERAYEKLHREHAKLLNDNKKLSDESKRGQSQAIFGADRMISQLGTLITSYFSLQTAVQAVNQALEDKRRLGQEALDTQILAAKGEAQTIKAMGGLTPAAQKRMFSGLADIQRDVGFSNIFELNRAGATALSSTNQNVDYSLGLVGTAAPLMRDQPEQLSDMASRMADIERSTGEKNHKRTAAFVLSAVAQMRIDNLKQMDAVVPALTAGDVTSSSADRVGSMRDAAAIFAAIGTRTGDVEGRKTNTATITILERLREMYPENDRLMGNGTVIKGTGLNNPMARLERLWASPRDQAKLRDMGWEKGTGATVEELISGPNTETGRTFMEARSKIRINEKDYDEMVQALASGTSRLQMASASDQSAANIKDFESNDKLGRESSARAILQETLWKTRPRTQLGMWGGPLMDSFYRTRFETNVLSGMDPALAAHQELVSRRLDIEEMNFETGKTKKLTDEDRVLINLIERQNQILLKMHDGLRSPSKAQGQVGVGREN